MDIIVQKNVNLAIQMPNDTSRPLFHKDTPLSSKYEVVLWIPLVDCSKSIARPHWQEYVCVSELSLPSNDVAVVHAHLSPCTFS